MMINHHPDDALLLGYASGSLEGGQRIVVASHVEGCAHCTSHVSFMNAVGGALLGEIEPDPLGQEVFEKTLARVDALSAEAARPVRTGMQETKRKAAAAERGLAVLPDLPGDIVWPEAMKNCSATPWRWLGPGMRWSRVRVPQDPAANVFLLRIGAGRMLPIHTHSDTELTQVLYGTFHDGRALFGRGDFDEADDAIEHQPVVQAGSECICLAAVSGKVLFRSAVARALGSMVGM